MAVSTPDQGISPQHIYIYRKKGGLITLIKSTKYACMYVILEYSENGFTGRREYVHAYNLRIQSNFILTLTWNKTYAEFRYQALLHMITMSYMHMIQMK